MTAADVRTLAQKGARTELAELKARVAELEAFITRKRKPYKTRKDKGKVRSAAYRRKLSKSMKAVWARRTDAAHAARQIA
jgi:hypothetical protein